MEKEKMIEEMAKVMRKDICHNLICKNCNTSRCYVDGKCHEYHCAKILIEQGYRKIPEGAVVLTKESQERIEQRVSALEKRAEELKQVRKETAMEIVDKLFSYMGKNQNFILVGGEPNTWIDCLKMWDFVLEIAKQFGVEVEE